MRKVFETREHPVQGGLFSEGVAVDHVHEDELPSDRCDPVCPFVPAIEGATLAVDAPEPAFEDDLEGLELSSGTWQKGALEFLIRAPQEPNANQE
jgi:hypothetical protein